MEHTFTIILKNNASVIQLVQNGPVSPVVPGLFLALDFSLGLCLNLLLVLTVATCPALRPLPFNRLLLHLCAVCSADCVINLLAAVAFVTLTHAELPPEYLPVMSAACRTNAALTQWTTAIQSVQMAALAVDRALWLRQADRSSRLTKRLPVLAWLYGTLLVSPIVITSHAVAVRLFPDRYACGIVPASDDLRDLLYPSLLLTLGYIVPWTVTLVVSVIIARHVISTRRRHQQMEEAILKRRQATGTSVVPQHSTSNPTSWSNWSGAPGSLSWADVRLDVLSCVLLLLYAVLLVPHILCVNIPPLTAVAAVEVSSVPNNSSLSELSTVLTGTHDCIFVWCRYKFALLVPIFIFAFHKEVRKTCEHMFCSCCCRNNSVLHLDTPRSVSACVERNTQLSLHELNTKSKQVTRKLNSHKKCKYSRMADYTTPVLFATSEGLHLRYVDDRLQGSPGSGRAGRNEPGFVCEFCDVALIVSTPTDSDCNRNSRQSVRRGPRRPVFSEGALAEEDMHVSDDVAGDIRQGSACQELLLATNNNNTTRHRQVDIDNRKATRVRFAHTVREIPLSESGVWSAPEDQVSVEQLALHTQDESQNATFSQLKPKC